MCYPLIGFVLESLIVLSVLMANLDYMWQTDSAHGGIWAFCSQNSTECQFYKASHAKMNRHEYQEITASRGMLIIAMILCIPIFFIMIAGCALQCCTPVPCQWGVVFASVQLLFVVIAGALVTHGFITCEGCESSTNWCFWMLWAAVVLSVTLVVVTASASCKCWGRIDKLYKKRAGKPEKPPEKPPEQLKRPTARVKRSKHTSAK